MLKRILLGLGGTEFTSSAIRHAVEIAACHQASVTGITVIDLEKLENVGSVPAGATQWAKDLREHRLKVARRHVAAACDEFVQACKSAGIPFELFREQGEAFDLMISEARYYDLMIFGLRSLFEYDFLADPCETLVRLVSHGVRPILAVAPEHRAVGRVLIAYSGSMESAKSMRRFVQLGLWPTARFRVVTFQAGATAEGATLPRNAAAYCRAHGLNVEEDFVEGPGKPDILRYAAEWGADLIVIGNSARSVILKKVFGDTAKHAIQHSDRPLFLCQ
jgi:nucleotide-binding universal stress UspA family protein